MDRIKSRVLTLFLLALATLAWAGQAAAALPVQMRAAVQEDLGQYVARRLSERYADTSDCNALAKPVFWCNGVIIRGTRDDLDQPVWDTATKDAERGAVTFAYLRSDVKYKALINGRSNGYIFSDYRTGSGMLRPQVRCFFPLSADTSSRDVEGCGAYKGSAQSAPCHTLGVETGAQWLAHFKANGGNIYEGQCGFDLTAEDEMAQSRFASGLQATSLLGSESFNSSNELVLRPWANGQGGKLPLEAFFYVAGSGSGLSVARRNQQALLGLNGVRIPVIELTLPTTIDEPAAFAYRGEDQAVGMPLVTDQGSAVAASLTARYAMTVSDCDVTLRPAFWCSGVMLKGLAQDLPQPVWNVSRDDARRGAVSFAYLRTDIKVLSLPDGENNGYLFKDYRTARSEWRPEVRCIFPLMAGTASRLDEGCGPYPGNAYSEPCHTQSVDTAAKWLAHFTANGADPLQTQCGFFITPAYGTQRFDQAVQARALAQSLVADSPSELMVSAWSDNQGKKLPLEAFFYVAGSEAGLSAARRNQLALQDMEDVTVPVIAIHLPANAQESASFTYTAADQALPLPAVIDQGVWVAASVTARYADTNPDCGAADEPAFLCSGVMLRGTSNNPTYHVWNNSAASIARGGVSFSYLRADAHLPRLAYTYNNGYFMAAYSRAEDLFNPEALCFFPTDGDSVDRQERGCGAHSGRPGSEPCHRNGITTAEQWWEHYRSHDSARDEWQCGFAVSTDREQLAGPAFHEGIKAMTLLKREPVNKPNDLELTVWEDGLGKQLPLEAFFYLEGSAGLAVAQRNQQDLLVTDNVVIPVIRLKLPATDSDLAEILYDPADQTLSLPAVPVRP